MPLSSWVRNCRKKLEHKKDNGTQLKGRRSLLLMWNLALRHYLWPCVNLELNHLIFVDPPAR